MLLVIDWNPLIAALAVVLTTAAPGIATLLVVLANNRKLGAIHEQTNGSMATLREEVGSLRDELRTSGISSTTEESHR